MNILLSALVLHMTILVVVLAYKGATSTKLITKKVYCSGELYEGPHWSTEENALYWVDILGQTVLRLEPKTGYVTSRKIGYGFVTLVLTVEHAPKLLLITVKTALHFLRWDSPERNTSLRQLTQVDLGQPDNTANDGKVDAKGRLWFGTLGKITGEDLVPDKGSLYMVNYKNYANPELKVRPVSLSNGIAWSLDNRYMYYIDSPTRGVDRFDFNLLTGEISNRITIFKFHDYKLSGIPDGMTIDTDGHLWVACYNGGKVIKIDAKRGKLLAQYLLPADKITSVMWGGPNLATLYVTSGSNGLNATQLAQQPYAGCLISIEGTGSRGLPENQFKFPNASNY